MQNQTTTTVSLSEAEERKVMQYANLHGLTLEEAVTRLVKQEIQVRFVRPKVSAWVLPFIRRQK